MHFFATLLKIRDCGTLFRLAALGTFPQGEGFDMVRIVFLLTGRYEILRCAQDDTVGKALRAPFAILRNAPPPLSF